MNARMSLLSADRPVRICDRCWHFVFLFVVRTQTITEAQMAALMPRLLPPAWRGKSLVPWRPLAPAPGMRLYIAFFFLVF